MNRPTLSLDGIVAVNENTASDSIGSLDNAVEMDFSDIKTKEEVKATIQERRVRAVNVYSLEGEFIATYDSIAEAAEAIGIHSSIVNNCCAGACLFSKKYNKIFLYREDDIEERLRCIEACIAKHCGVARKVDEYNLRGRFLFQYPSSVMAAKVNKLTPQKISSCCNSKILYIGNRIFLWHGDDIQRRLPAVKEALYLESARRKKCRPVDEYTLDGQYVKGFPSCSAASKEYNIDVTIIWRCCKGVGSHGRSLQTHGKIFLFAGDSISNRIDLINGLKNNRK